MVCPCAVLRAACCRMRFGSPLLAFSGAVSPLAPSPWPHPTQRWAGLSPHAKLSFINQMRKNLDKELKGSALLTVLTSGGHARAGADLRSVGDA